MLRPTFLSFETARKSITAAQLGLDTVGHNTANTDTPGYSRQRVDQVSFAVGNTGRFATFGKQLPGQGTLVTGINRIRDPFLDNRYRMEASNVGELDVKALAMVELNRIFDEIEVKGLNVKFDELIDAFAKLQFDPSSSEHALVVRTYTQQLAQMMNKYATDINTVERQTYSDFTVEVGELSKTLQQIAYYNEKIMQQHIYGNPANELMDERDLLLDKLASLTDIVITREEVKISDSHSVEKLIVRLNDLNGIDLVNGNRCVQFSVPHEPQPPTLGNADPGYNINLYDFNGNLINSNAAALFKKGSITGYLDMLNGRGSFAGFGENTVRGIPYYRAAFDELPKTLVKEMNYINAADTPIYQAAFDVNRIISHLNSPEANVTLADATNNVNDFLTAIDNVGTAPGSSWSDPAHQTDLQAAAANLQAAINLNPPNRTAVNQALYAMQETLKAVNDVSPPDIDAAELQALNDMFATMKTSAESFVSPDNMPNALAALRAAIDDLGPHDTRLFELNQAFDLIEAEYNNQISAGAPPFNTEALTKIYDNEMKLAVGAMKPLLEFGDPNRPAETISITQAWRDNPLYVTRYVDELPVNVDRFIRMLTLDSYAFPNGQSEGTDTFIRGTFQKYLVSFAAELALDQNIYETLLVSADKALNALEDNRQAVSGVSMNEESISLMTYQNYYNAALRYMTTVDEALDQLINRMGLVGR